MVQQRPGPAGANRGGGGRTPSGGSGSGAAWIIGIIAVGGIIAVSQHPSTTTSGTGGNEAVAADMGNAQQALVSAVAAQKPPPTLALSPAAVRRGASRVTLAARERTAGQMIYSQNCYDALGRAFSWHKLDECGAFDNEAGLAVADDPTATPAEAAWFQSEAAAGRYLKAAAAAGLEATGADDRIAGLQRQVGRRHRAASSTVPAAAPSEDATPTSTPIAPPLGNFG